MKTAHPLLRVRLLGVRLELLDDEGVCLDLGRSPAQRLAVAALAAAAPGEIARLDHRHFSSAEARNLAIRRAFAGSGLTGDREGAHARLDPSVVDLHHLLAEAERPLDECTLESVRRALDLVGTGGPCPELESMAVFPRFTAALDELRQRERALKRGRVLIVEDIIGDDLRRQLARHDCTVVTSWDEFKEIPDLHAFDLALVDLHLSDQIDDKQGEQVRTTLQASGVRYPIIMMTANAWADLDVSAYIKKHGVFVVLKGAPRTGQSAAVIDRVNSLMDDDLEGVMIDQLRDQLVALRAQAASFIALRQRRREDAEKKTVEMNTEWAGLWLVLDERDPGRLRAAVAQFQRRWA